MERSDRNRLEVSLSVRVEWRVMQHLEPTAYSLHHASVEDFSDNYEREIGEQQ